MHKHAVQKPLPGRVFFTIVTMCDRYYPQQISLNVYDRDNLVIWE